MEPYLHSRLNAHGMLRADDIGGIVPRTLCKETESKRGKTLNNIVKMFKTYYCEFPIPFCGWKFIFWYDL